VESILANVKRFNQIRAKTAEQRKSEFSEKNGVFEFASIFGFV
jgi:hypothetical protein